MLHLPFFLSHLQSSKCCFLSNLFNLRMLAGGKVVDLLDVHIYVATYVRVCVCTSNQMNHRSHYL